MTVFVYVNTSKQIGDAEHIKVFANDDAARVDAAYRDALGQRESRIPPVRRLPHIAAR